MIQVPRIEDGDSERVTPLESADSSASSSKRCGIVNLGRRRANYASLLLGLIRRRHIDETFPVHKEAYSDEQTI